MKTLAIYQREVLERTGFKKWPFKKVSQFVIYYGGKKILSNCHVNIDDPDLRVKFERVYNSRSFIKFNLLLNDLFKKNDKRAKALYRMLKELEDGITWEKYSRLTAKTHNIDLEKELESDTYAL